MTIRQLGGLAGRQLGAPAGRQPGKLAGRRLVLLLLACVFVASAGPALAEPMSFKIVPNFSRATFTLDAPLETVVGNTAGPGVEGTLEVDPARPAGATGVVRVDLATIRTGIERRDSQMVGPQYLDTAREVNRWATFEIRSVEIGGPLVAGAETRAKVRGTLTIKERPVEVVADARVSYLRLTAEQLAAGQQRFGFTTDNLKVRATLATTFRAHGLEIPQVLVFRLANDVKLEIDLTFVRTR